MADIFFPENASEVPPRKRHTKFPGHGISRTSVAKWMYWSRTVRPDEGIERLYGEAVWDILLDLYIHGSEGKRVSVTSMCIGSGVAPTTALRYVSMLIDAGWVERENDNVDHRRAFVSLTPVAKKRLDSYLDAVIAKMWSITPDSLVEAATGDFSRLMATMQQLLEELQSARGNNDSEG